MPTRIKICSICSEEDADLAVAAGADFIGLIFHPASKRYVDLDLAREIIVRLPGNVIPVGVFVDAPLETLAHIAWSLGIYDVQLHGDESPEYAAAVAGLPLRFYKALPVDEHLPQALATWRAAYRDLGSQFAGIVLESAAPVVSKTTARMAGGSGIPNNWPAIRRLIDQGEFNDLPPLIASGGLTPQTVYNVVKLIHPYAIDVSSGVEAQIRKKDPVKIAAFIAETCRADN